MKQHKIKGCHDCPCYGDEYCQLAIWMMVRNIDRGDCKTTFRLNEWRAETMPNDCPLKSYGSITLTVT